MSFSSIPFFSHLYDGPISLTDRSPEPDKLTQISSTVEQFPDYIPEGPVRKARVVQAVAIRPNYLSSAVAGHTYFIHEDGHRYSIPVISLQVQEDLLFGYDDGLYTAGVDFDTWRLENPEAPFPGERPPWSLLPYNSNRRGDQWSIRDGWNILRPFRMGLRSTKGSDSEFMATPAVFCP